jgi:hypothetical protein
MVSVRLRSLRKVDSYCITQQWPSHVHAMTDRLDTLGPNARARGPERAEPVGRRTPPTGVVIISVDDTEPPPPPKSQPSPSFPSEMGKESKSMSRTETETGPKRESKMVSQKQSGNQPAFFSRAGGRSFRDALFLAWWSPAGAPRPRATHGTAGRRRAQRQRRKSRRKKLRGRRPYASRWPQCRPCPHPPAAPPPPRCPPRRVSWRRASCRSWCGARA